MRIWPDDDTNLNSRLMFTAEEDGTYYISRQQLQQPIPRQ